MYPGIWAQHTPDKAAAIHAVSGEILERFPPLVNPGHEIPPPIMRITGIRNEMLVGQPRIDEVM